MTQPSAEWRSGQRVGLITQRSQNRNLAPLQAATTELDATRHGQRTASWPSPVITDHVRVASALSAQQRRLQLVAARCQQTGAGQSLLFGRQLHAEVRHLQTTRDKVQARVPRTPTRPGISGIPPLSTLGTLTAEWRSGQRVGLITQRSQDRNLESLKSRHFSFWWCPSG